MRHFDVGDEDVGLVRKYGFERFFAVARLATTEMSPSISSSAASAPSTIP